MPARFLMSLLTTVLALAMPGLAQAQEEEGRLLFGGDRYLAGQDITADEPTSGDLFIAGEEVVIRAPVAGAAHMAGRRIGILSEIEGAIYAMGYEISLDAPAGGNVTVAGAEIDLAAPIAGNLRVAGADIRLSAPVAGSAILGGDDVYLDAAVSGDVILGSADPDFGSGASIGGTLVVYVEEGREIEIPESVIPAERVTFRDIERFEAEYGPAFEEIRARSLRAAIMGFILSILAVAALAAIAVVVAPERVAEMRARALERPWWSLLVGFVTLSALIGSTVVFAMTVIGIPLAPASIFAAGFAGLAGYVLGSYILGVGVWIAIGKPAPTEIGPKVGLAALGATLAGLATLVPFLGWLFTMALMLVGLGAITSGILNHRRGRSA